MKRIKGNEFEQIRYKLQYPKLVLEMMMEKGVNRNNVPIEFLDDGVRAIKQIHRLLNKIERVKGKGMIGG